MRASSGDVPTAPLFDPGQTVRDLAGALSSIPLRAASTPVAATLTGFAGMYLEWSMPADIDFAECDAASAKKYDDLPDGQPIFLRWQTPTGGESFETVRGQLDRLWILDVDGNRIVIDVWQTPLASVEDIDQLENVIRSLEVVAP